MPSKSKILIVDDDPQSRQLYASLLTPFGHQVLEARDGREGLEVAKREKPDLIVSDILMPTMNGYEFVTAIRKFPSLQNVPVIFHSASFLDREARALGASCGVSLYILKPSDPERILDKVERPAPRTALPDPDGVPQRGTETILFAEDAESIREMTREYLESLGYTMMEAGSGAEALQRSNDFEGTIHLLLTDVVMPELNGRELADQIISKRPHIKTLFTSGYTDDAIVRHDVLEPGVTFVQKPYRPKALARKIREVLGEPSTKASNHTASGLQTPINT